MFTKIGKTVTGKHGPTGPEGRPGVDGVDGIDGVNGDDGVRGKDGKFEFVVIDNTVRLRVNKTI